MELDSIFYEQLSALTAAESFSLGYTSVLAVVILEKCCVYNPNVNKLTFHFETKYTHTHILVFFFSFFRFVLFGWLVSNQGLPSI